MKPESVSYIDLQVRASVDAGEILALLEDCDPLGAWEGDGVMHFWWDAGNWNSQILQEMRVALNRMGIDPNVAEIKVVSVPDQDWNAQWAQSVRPIRIGRNVLVRQSWNPIEIPFEGVTLIIDPKRAFGSGYHATTQLLVEMLENKIGGGEEVLDVGTGSGILSMVAIRLGARSALGIDNDPVAIECAKENATNNGFGPELELRACSWEALGPAWFDLILANIDRKVLMEYSCRLKRHLKPDGSALLSGLQPTDWDDISATIERNGGRVCDRREREEWMALEVRY